MLKNDAQAIASIGNELQMLISEFQERIRYRELKDEEDITSRFLERLQGALTFKKGGLQLKTKAITIAKSKEEPKVGADILVVTRYQSPKLDISKGFLAQAKNLQQGHAIYGDARKRLIKQCEDMQAISNENYVWCYSSSSMRVHRGFLVQRLQSNRPDDLSYAYLKDFLLKFLVCRHGDPSISFGDIPRLQEIIERLNISYALLVSARSGPESGPSSDGSPEPDGSPPELEKLALKIGGKDIVTDEKDRIEQRSMYREYNIMQTVDLDALADDDGQKLIAKG